MERPLDELEKLILRHLASGPCSASELADALHQHGVAPSRPAVVYRLGGLVSLKLVVSAERKAQRGGAEFIYSLRSEPKATTEAAPPSADLPKTEPPKGTQELQPKEDAPPAQVSPKATKGESKSPSNRRQDGPPPKLAPAPREVYPQGREDYIRQRRAALVRAGLIKGASRCTR